MSGVFDGASRLPDSNMPLGIIVDKGLELLVSSDHGDDKYPVEYELDDAWAYPLADVCNLKFFPIPTSV